jgi:hypothetical protein
LIGINYPRVVGKETHNKAFVDVVTRSDIVWQCVKSSHHELGAHNQTREKVVETDKDTGKNNGRWHGFDKAHKSLPKIGVNGKVEREEPLGSKETNM